MKRSQTYVEVLGASFERDGAFVSPDWRYDVWLDCLRESPSAEAIRRRQQGLPTKWLPSDYESVQNVLEDFGAFRTTLEREWWQREGIALFGLKAPSPKVQLAGLLSGESKALALDWSGVDCVVLQVPTCLSHVQALRELKNLLASVLMSERVDSPVAPKYTLMPSKLRQETLLLGLKALRLYRRTDQALWEIGAKLQLIPGCKEDLGRGTPSRDVAASAKIELASAARKLIRQTLLVVENAARGRFPCKKPFPEAQMDAFRRKVGRPARKKTSNRDSSNERA